MADRAYLLIRIENALDSESVERVMGAIHHIEQVEFIDRVLGPYELIVTVEASDIESIVNLVKAIPGVKDTALCKVVTTAKHPAHAQGHVIAIQED